MLATATGCGGRAQHTLGDETNDPARFEQSVLAQGPDLRFEAISDDGALIAFSAAANATALSARDVWVVNAEGGDAQRIGSVHDLDSARFDGTTLLVFRGDGVADGSIGEPCTGKACGPPAETWAPELLAWRPNDTTLTSLATDVDPGSVRFSRDGRWISLEANDPPPPDGNVPDVFLVDTIDLSVRKIGSFDLARARFTRQSDWLVFGGRGHFLPAPDIEPDLPDANRCNGHQVARLSLRDGRARPVTCYDSLRRARWEVSPDGNWLIHGLRSSNSNALARTPIEGGAPEILATGLAHAETGKSFDTFGGNRPQVAFIKTVPTDTTHALFAVNLENDSAERQITNGCVHLGSGSPLGVDGIGDHHDGTLTFRGCEQLHAVPVQGGTAVSLGRHAAVIDELDQRFLALDDDGTLRLFRASTGRAEVVASSTTAARFIAGNRVLTSSGPSEPPWALTLFDAGGTSLSLGEITGPFGVDPRARSSFVTTREIGGQSSLVRIALVGE